MAAIIFANCAVLDGTRKERREDHHVLVEDRNIREVSDRPISSATAETIDLSGRIRTLGRFRVSGNRA